MVNYRTIDFSRTTGKLHHPRWRELWSLSTGRSDNCSRTLGCWQSGSGSCRRHVPHCSSRPALSDHRCCVSQPPLCDQTCLRRPPACLWGICRRSFVSWYPWVLPAERWRVRWRKGHIAHRYQRMQHTEKKGRGGGHRKNAPTHKTGNYMYVRINWRTVYIVKKY